MPANIYDLVPVLMCDIYMAWIMHMCTLVGPNSWDHLDRLTSVKKLHVVTCNFFCALWLLSKQPSTMELLVKRRKYN